MNESLIVGVGRGGYIMNVLCLNPVQSHSCVYSHTNRAYD